MLSTWQKQVCIRAFFSKWHFRTYCVYAYDGSITWTLAERASIIMNGDITLEALRQCQCASKVMSPFICR